MTPSVPNPLPHKCGGLRLLTPRVLPPANVNDVKNDDAQKKILERGLNHWDVSLCFWALTDAGRRLVDSPTPEYRIKPDDQPLYEALKAIKDIRNQKYGRFDGRVDEESWTEIEKEVLKLCEVLDGEFANQAADGSELAKLRTLVTRKLEDGTDNMQAMYYVQFFEKSVLDRVVREGAADLEAQTSKLRRMQQSTPAGAGSEETTLQDVMKAMQEELMEANTVHGLATRVGCQVGALTAKINQAKINQANQEELMAVMDGKPDMPIMPPPARPEQEVQQMLAVEAARAVLASAADGVDWPHCRLQVRGPGGVGKSSTIDAMSGKKFTPNFPSTAGAMLTTCEVERRSLEVASEGRPLRIYNLADGETEHARAVAVAAQGWITEAAKQASDAEKATGAEGRRSMLADEEPRQAGMAPNVMEAAKTTPALVSVQNGPQRTSLIQGLGSHAPLQQKAAEEEEKQRQAAEEKQRQAAELAAAAGKLVIKGTELPRLVLHIQDSGGQDVFLSVLDLLHAPKASVSILVFSLPDLQNPDLFKSSIAQLRVQLDSFAVHASKSPLLLVGTRKDEVVAAGGDPHHTQCFAHSLFDVKTARSESIWH